MLTEEEETETLEDRLDAWIEVKLVLTFDPQPTIIKIHPRDAAYAERTLLMEYRGYTLRVFGQDKKIDFKKLVNSVHHENNHSSRQWGKKNGY
ncbi:MAG: hypothetical protein COA78_07130 [Blastopirellula sp.]|nr:MAG: hypothetical protein COA78_07130 [Blastopirellula sp.]